MLSLSTVMCSKLQKIKVTNNTQRRAVSLRRTFLVMKYTITTPELSFDHHKLWQVLLRAWRNVLVVTSMSTAVFVLVYTVHQ